MKHFFIEICELCDKYYCETIEFRSIRGLGMSTCIATKSCETYLFLKKKFLSDS